jgi:hypothetical protein
MFPHCARAQPILGLIAISGLLMFLMNGTNLPFSDPTIEKFSGGLQIHARAVQS